jgi:regulator of protease activity HflC (stomatin/prohibitin superfamily)
MRGAHFCGRWRITRSKISWSGVASHPRCKQDNVDTNDTLKTPPVSLISVSIPIQFQITNIVDWVYTNSNPNGLLEELATRAVVHYLAGADMNAVLSRDRLRAAQVLRDDIQTAANAHSLGAKIVFVGLEDIHPPTASQVAATYEKVVGAGRRISHRICWPMPRRS